MEYSQMIRPREVQIDGKTFCVSKIPALYAIPIRNSITAILKDNGSLGIAMFGERLTRDLLQYCAYNDNGNWEPFITDKRINAAFEDDATLLRLTTERVKENFGFFLDGRLPSLLGIAEEE